jgi:dinuclear metal center YbgI/SA1388 family protein
MKIKDICKQLESIAPLSYQESYDNSGLLVGNPNTEIKKALISLDMTEAVIDEAIRGKCGLVIAHHPIIFGGLKKLNGKNYVERVVIKAIKHDIALYAIHTNLDNVQQGVNARIAAKLGLEDVRILQPMSGQLKKLVTFIPKEQHAKVSAAIHAAGAGNIGNYSETGFSQPGTGTFRGNEHSNPAIGKAGKLEQVEEIRFETIFPNHLQSAVIQALLSSHPYEEVAYDIYKLENSWDQLGAGMIGTLSSPVDELTFLKKIKKTFNAQGIRHTEFLNKKVEVVALCGGSGAFLLPAAIASGADCYISADIKYHQFFDADGRILLADIGHYESEQYTKELISELIRQKYPTFALQISSINTNPIKYL